ncbi:peroxisome biogenesis factor 10-like [Schistocerca piceifrons]|uniref:peroxisome biogenesis factor 10-like n=1 Tax=Schistocerca piceifrons TaxID=274613 RepID=UPI001F5F52D1|nr:peroxisome biogenesis factor 10-like [Schistocerca piceifrons]XP_047102690.1 peroxisome biogenesis factor 10-like [Schistocerca piceifrons]XP_047102691.1 peroxisome biogenesis factor 10-like [Schistocerca piceifrons]XP_047102692.1 peroxisome biogenesis factor 10-like [Schistocerca piceifrons]XP_047118617.1 peroxisome biogenesis factor 10-like [Schistocerca piceifrons]
MVFTTAGRAEILRASQKDELVSEKMRSQLAEVLLRTLGSHWFRKYSKWTSVGSRNLYYALTTLSGFQTLGEEYTGIVMVDQSLRKVPSKFERFVMISAQCEGLLLLTWLMKKLRVYIDKLPSTSDADEEACQKASKLMLLAEKCLPFFEKIHTTLFYLNGTYLALSKRLTGIRYVLHHHWIKDHSTDTVFKAVLISSVTYLLLALYHGYRKLLHEFSHSVEKTQYSTNIQRIKGHTCSLCLEELASPSATTCGHVFCWSCILEWLKSQEQCPVCKDGVTPNKVIMLQNFP